MEFLFLTILFAGYSVVYSWDSSSGEYEKRQLVPLPRIGRSYSEGKRQGLIPSPRVGRSSYNGIDSNDCTFTPESCNKLLEYNILHEVHDVVPVVPLLSLKPIAGIIPLKRSSAVVEDYANNFNVDDFELSKTLRSNPSQVDIKQDFFERNTRQLIPAPRVGRSGPNHKNQMQLISGLSAADDDDMIDPIDVQLRAAFIPRLGKRAPVRAWNQFYDLDDTYKRASAAFTPRIGRAAFTPRIGKKAAFVPRIGRSVDKVANDLGNSHSSH